jgi:DNA-binding transcriptional MerR regulator
MPTVLHMTSPPVMTATEVAAALGVNHRTVQRWTDDGRLKPLRQKPLIYDAADVQALAAELAAELGDMVRDAARAS